MVEVVAVYESLDTSAPILDKLTFVSGLSLNTTSILGERVRGAESGAVAQLATQSSATEIEIVYLTQNKFQIGESITFEESNIVTNLQDITTGSFLDISNKYELDKGQKLQYYDYSKIVRKTGLPAPARQLLIVHNSYQVPANDDGDVYTVDSYPQERFTKDIPILPNGKRASDVLDFRPRVTSAGNTNVSTVAGSAVNPALSTTIDIDSDGSYVPVPNKTFTSDVTRITMSYNIFNIQVDSNIRE